MNSLGFVCSRRRAPSARQEACPLLLWGSTMRRAGISAPREATVTHLSLPFHAENKRQTAIRQSNPRRRHATHISGGASPGSLKSEYYPGRARPDTPAGGPPGTNPKQDYETNPIRSFVFNTSSILKPNSSRRMAALKPRGHPGLSSLG